MGEPRQRRTVLREDAKRLRGMWMLGALAVVVAVAFAARPCPAGGPAKGEIRMGASSTNPSVVTVAAPQGEKLCEDYELRVGGQKVPVYAARVSAICNDAD